MYLIGDYVYCKKLIEQQLEASLNHEYLYFMKVKVVLKYFQLTSKYSIHTKGENSKGRRPAE
jgi:hypothetical protein